MTKIYITLGMWPACSQQETLTSSWKNTLIYKQKQEEKENFEEQNITV